MSETYGDEYQQLSKYHRDRMPGGRLDWAGRPDTYKTYKGVEIVALPEPSAPAAATVAEALKARRSVRSYLPKALEARELSYLLWAAGGVQRRQDGYEFRTAPSAGALYPIETYLVVNRVEDVESGLYHYRVAEHALERLRAGMLGRAAAEAALHQDMVAAAPVVFVWTAVFERCKWKYRQRAYRYIYLDAGHMAENLALAAAARGLGTCQIGAFFDDEINELVGVDGTGEAVVYMSVVGWPA